MNILGHDYKVKRWGTMDEIGAMGRHHPRTQVIQVCVDIHSEQLESTVLHEILEAFNWLLELGLEHNQKQALEAALWQTFRANGVDLSPLTAEIEEAPF